MKYPKLNILHDNRLFGRIETLLSELKLQGITDYRIWDAIEDTNNVVRSINISHKQIVQDAKDKGLPFVVIGEDDLTFTSNKSWEYFLSNMPKQFDLYLACTYCPPITNKKVCGFHLYAVGESFYDKFLSVPETKHIDTAMDDLEGDYVFCYPFPALQKSGYSTNNKAVVNYNNVLSKDDIYLCF